MSGYQNNSIFWVETEKIGANPFQPRREFNQKSLEDLADSIRQYGVLQPLVVTRKEEQSDNGGISVYYELIAGERRLRASRMAGLEQVPVIIRKDVDDKVKLELSIIENLQREDLNPIDRALAFNQLYKDFNLTHADIGKKMGKSRVYVSNSLRLLSLPDNIKQGLMDGTITEGHTRPLLMLSDRPEEQETLYKEIALKKMSVRESEKVARSIAQDKVRKKKFIRDPRIRDFEKRLSDNLGTRVQIEQREKGGKITIDYFSVNDLESILNSIKKVDHGSAGSMMESYVNRQEENKSKQIISGSSPVNFIYNNTNTVRDNDEFKDNINNLDEDFLPEIKRLDSFEHTQNTNIVEYRDELEGFIHSPNDEIIVKDIDKQSAIENNLNVNIDNSTIQNNQSYYSDYDQDDLQNNGQIRWKSSSDFDNDISADHYYNDSSYNDNYKGKSYINDNNIQNKTQKKKNFINRMFS